MAIIFLMIMLFFASDTVEANVNVSSPAALTTLDYQPQLAKFVARVIERYDYQKVGLDRAMSEKIFDRYLVALDPQKIYFTQSDIRSYLSKRETLGDAICQEDLHFPFAMFNLYQRRVIERFTFSQGILKEKFNSQGDERSSNIQAKNS